MVRIVEPTQGPERKVFPTRLAVVHRYGGGDWIVPSDEDIQATRDPILTDGAKNAFNYQSGQTVGLDITFATGEAFIGGSYCASDTAGQSYHDVTLPASSTGVPVYLGYRHNGMDELYFGLAGAFNSQDPKVEMYQFDTDATTVTDFTDVRPLGAENADVDVGTNLAQLDARYVQGATDDVAFLAQDETIPGLWTHTDDLRIHKGGATIEVGGDNGGPHTVEFGNDAGEDKLRWIYRTSPDELRLETASGTQYLGLPLAANSPFDFKDQQIASFLYEKRTGNPTNPSQWRTWARTDIGAAGELLVETADGPYTIEMTPFVEPGGELVVDGFEDDDMSEYNIPSSSGTAAVVTSRSRSGARSLELAGTVNPRSHPSYSPKLPYYPRAGDKWEFWFNFNVIGAGSSFRFYYGKQVTEEVRNAYEIHCYQDGTFRVEKDVASTNTTIASQNIGSFTEDIWYRVRVWWQHSEQVGDHHLELWNNNTSTVEATISGNDDTYGSGGILLWNGSGTTINVDDIQILSRE